MKAATIVELKKELKQRPPEELLELCLRLARFKKENKELLTYLLFEADNEDFFVQKTKEEISSQFTEINTDRFYFIKKSVRKILRETKKHNRYSNKKETEVELLLHFCRELKKFKPSIKQNRMLVNLYERQLGYIERKIEKLHEDLQHDYTVELNELPLYRN